MIIKDIMSSPVYTIDPNASAIEANELMWRHQVHHLIVTSQEEIVGILSDTDLGGDEATEIPDNLLVKQIMSTPVTKVSTSTLLEKACNLMKGNNFHSLPVLDENNKLVGIVTQSDLERLQKRGKAQGPFQGQQRPIEPSVPPVRRTGTTGSARRA
jgi:CBS domain-containing protein